MMKSLLRLGALLLVALLVFSPIVTNAQGTAPNTCPTGLQKADCDLVDAAFNNKEATGKFSNFEMAYTFNLKAISTGAQASNTDVKVTGTGVFGLDSSVTAGASDPFAALSALKFSNVIKSEAKSDGKTTSGTLEFRILNGTFYVKSAALTQDKWQSISLAELLSAAMSAQASMGSDNPATGVQSVATDPEVIQAITDAFQEPGVITGTAAAGPTVEGAATRRITVNINLNKAVSSPKFQPALKAIAKQQFEGAEPTADQVAKLQQQVSAALKTSILNFSWDIVPTDKTIRGFAFTAALKLDEATVKLLGATQSGTLDFTTDFNIQFLKVGTPVKLEAPADATPLKIPGMPGMMPGAVPTPRR
jgi:hypothetical protein